MLPFIHEGDLIEINKDNKDAIGKMALVLTNEGSEQVTFVQWSAGGYILEQTYPKHQYTKCSDIHIIGTVKKVIVQY